MNLLGSIVCALQLATFIYGLSDTRQNLFKKVDILQGVNPDSQYVSVLSLTECAERCLEAGCTGFAGKAVDGVYQCSLSTDARNLDQSEWDIYPVDCNVPRPPSITFLKRTDNTTDFYRIWADFKDGFGDENNFWLGLEKLHMVTNSGNFGLMAKMTAWDGREFWAYYSSFSVGPESDNYELSVSGYDPDSTTGDSLSYHNGKEFTTRDADHDDWGDGNCADDTRGGWWHSYCKDSNPTGLYFNGGIGHYKGINWYYTPGYQNYYSFMKMSLVLIPHEVC